jgi:cell division protease FtsH
VPPPGILALVTLSQGAQPGVELSYSRFLADVGAGAVRAVTIGPAGQLTGSLATGQPFTTTIPVALDDRGLAGQLAAHHVQISAITATPSSSLPLLIGLLLLLLVGSLFSIAVRSTRREPAAMGGLTGTAGLTRAKARAIDARRPATRFADVAGYAAVKTEIGEVVDYLRDPGRRTGPSPPADTSTGRSGHKPTADTAHCGGPSWPSNAPWCANLTSW